jgi:hypothetical protein
MPGGTYRYPSRDEALEYLADYETRYDVPVVRPARVNAVRDDRERLVVDSSAGRWSARAVISATGTWRRLTCRDCRVTTCSLGGSFIPPAIVRLSHSLANASSSWEAGTPAHRFSPISMSAPA